MGLTHIKKHKIESYIYHSHINVLIKWVTWYAYHKRYLFGLLDWVTKTFRAVVEAHKLLDTCTQTFSFRSGQMTYRI